MSMTKRGLGIEDGPPEEDNEELLREPETEGHRVWKMDWGQATFEFSARYTKATGNLISEPTTIQGRWHDDCTAMTEEELATCERLIGTLSVLAAAQYDRELTEDNSPW